MSDMILVMGGGAIGAGLRHAAGHGLSGLVAATGWPVATLFVNVAGSLAMGLLAGLLARKGLADGWRLFIGIGILGGFTTFSAFSLEMARLLETGRWIGGIGYALASVTGSVAALFAGLALARLA